MSAPLFSLYGFYSNGERIVCIATRRRWKAGGGSMQVRTRILRTTFPNTVNGGRMATRWSADANRANGERIKRLRGW